MKDSVAPDYASPITAWRFWKIRRTSQDGNIWLRSLIRNELWPPMEKFEARDCERVPVAESKSGIYAYKSSFYALGNLDRCCYRGVFLGKVNLWGVIQRHQFGYRAQFAYPVSLIMGICCVCKKIVNLKTDQFAIGWASLHFTEAFSVSGFLCNECNEKYYSVEIDTSYRELSELVTRYGITIE
jgi:hypothetical protein